MGGWSIFGGRGGGRGGRLSGGRVWRWRRSAGEGSSFSRCRWSLMGRWRVFLRRGRGPALPLSSRGRGLVVRPWLVKRRCGRSDPQSGACSLRRSWWTLSMHSVGRVVRFLRELKRESLVASTASHVLRRARATFVRKLAGFCQKLLSPLSSLHGHMV